MKIPQFTIFKDVCNLVEGSNFQNIIKIGER